MPNILVTNSHDRIVRLAEIRERLAQIDIRDALAHVTKLASRQLSFPDTEEIVSKINLINLSQLAKAVVLYSSPNGRPLDVSRTDSNDLIWLLKAINSLQWYSRQEIDHDHDSTLISMLMRQQYLRSFVSDHPVNVIARAYDMFYERLTPANAQRVDLDAALRRRRVHEAQPRQVAFILRNDVPNALRRGLGRVRVQTTSLMFDTPEEILMKDWTGDCYGASMAWIAAVEEPDWIVVYGTVWSNAVCKRINHAWCERGGVIVDLAMPVGDESPNVKHTTGSSRLKSARCTHLTTH